MFAVRFTLRLGIGALLGLALAAPTPAHAVREARALSIEERIAAHRAIEAVLWRHRIWPSQNPGRKPPLDAILTPAALRERVEDVLRKSNALERRWGRPLTARQLQDEVERMVGRSRRPAVLDEMFEALGRDPFLIAECLARPVLADRLLRTWHGAPGSFDAWWRSERARYTVELEPPAGTYEPVRVTGSPCADDTWVPIENDAPDPRARHLAVWTGSEMIVWGGKAQDFGDLANGGRYDPTTDTWSPVSNGPNAPSGRESVSVVWTGTSMIVWGGADGTGPRNDGATYDPATDTWTPTSQSVGVPTPREGHSAVWTGSAMIIWGGRAGFDEYVDTGARYDPATGVWTPTRTIGGGVPQGRFAHSAVWTGTEMIVWGGVDHSSAAILQTGGRYNPVTDSWTATSTQGEVPKARAGHTAVWTGSRMVIWGGYLTTSGGIRTSSGGRYDPASNTWESTSLGAGCPSARSNHTAVWTGSRMIVWGGAGESVAFQDGARYDAVADTWTPTGTGSGLPATRWDHSAVWTGTEMIVFGGGVGTNTGARYRPADDSWIPTSLDPNVPAPREGHTAVWTGAEMIVWGGRGSSCSGCTPESTGGRYIPATDQWIPTTSAGAPEARHSHRAIWTGVEMIVWGGDGGNAAPTPLNTGGRYRPADDTWNPTRTGGATPEARYFHTTVWSGTRMIVWGGRTPAGWLNSGGLYDPTTDGWQSTSTAASVPQARQDHTAVWANTAMIVWGGAVVIDGHTVHLDDGGRYDPVANTWSTLGTAGALPTARRLHTAVWTGGEMIVWGGQEPLASANTGGIYDPATTSWRATSPADAPKPRRHHDAVWTGAEMVIWGGDPADFPFLPEREGGRYDPATDRWRLMNAGAEAPSARSYHSIVQADGSPIVWGGTPLTYTGAIYCAVPPCVLATWYFDQDLDGWGQSPMQACAPPPGWVAQGGDCADSDPGVYPGAPQACDGINTDCAHPAWPVPPADEADADGDGSRVCAGDCDDLDPTLEQAPGDVGELTAEWHVLDTEWIEITWPSLAGQAGTSTVYDTVRGLLSELRAGPSYEGAICTGNDRPSPVYVEPSESCPVAPGDGCWFLVRAQNGCGTGSFGPVAMDASSPCPSPRRGADYPRLKVPVDSSRPPVISAWVPRSRPSSNFMWNVYWRRRSSFDTLPRSSPPERLPSAVPE